MSSPEFYYNTYFFEEDGIRVQYRDNDVFLQLPQTAESLHYINEENYLYGDDTEDRQEIFNAALDYYYSQHETRDLAKASAALGCEIDELVKVSDDQGDEYYVAFYDERGEQYLLEGAGIIGYYGDYEFFTHDPIEDSALEKEMIEQARKKRVTECRV